MPQNHEQELTQFKDENSQAGFCPFDESLLIRTLSMNYDQRLDSHEAARQLVADLQKAGQTYYARQSKTSS